MRNIIFQAIAESGEEKCFVEDYPAALRWLASVDPKSPCCGVRCIDIKDGRKTAESYFRIVRHVPLTKTIERECKTREGAIDAALESASGPHVRFEPTLVTPEDGYTADVVVRITVAATVPAIVAELRRILAAIEGQ